MISVRLTRDEKLAALRVATAQQAGAKKDGKKLDATRGDGGPDNIYRGFCGEIAVANYTGEKWHAGELSYYDICRGGLKKIKDVGSYEVKTIGGVNHNYPVGANQADQDKVIFVLADIDLENRESTYYIEGWAYAHECKRKEYFGSKTKGGPPRYWIPRDSEIIKNLEELDFE